MQGSDASRGQMTAEVARPRVPTSRYQELIRQRRFAPAKTWADVVVVEANLLAGALRMEVSVDASSPAKQKPAQSNCCGRRPSVTSANQAPWCPQSRLGTNQESVSCMRGLKDFLPASVFKTNKQSNWTSSCSHIHACCYYDYYKLRQYFI